MPDYTLVLEKILNTPLLAHPGKAATVAGVVLREAGQNVVVDLEDPAPMQTGPLQEKRMRTRYEAYGQRPFLFDPSTGIAVIEVCGSLAHRQFHIGRSSGITGYDGLAAQLSAALEDREVRSIVFDIHSAGGEVSGAFQLGDAIYMARQVKPILAIADEMAFSAGYVIAAACDEVWLAHETAQVGSVGVVMVHFSFEENLALQGIKPTIIQAGARKADGNPFEDLPDAVAERLQGKIDAVYDIFVERVALWRDMGAAAVRNTQADTFMGEAALAAGLADGIAPPDDILEDLAARTRATRPELRVI